MEKMHSLSSASFASRIKSSFSWKWLVLILLIAIISCIRFRLLGFPLERDEGEYAYFGQLILQGIPPYKLAFHMKFPGVYFIYAGIMFIFGQTASAIHLGLLFVNAATIILVYFISKKLAGQAQGLIAAAVYGILSLSISILGFAAHATHFLVLFAMCATLILLNALEQGKGILYLFAGLLFGFAVLMKQSAVFFFPFALFCTIIQVVRKKLSFKSGFFYVAMLLLGFILPIFGLCVVLYMTGVFPRFWFWTVVYLKEYAAVIPLKDAPFKFYDALLKVIDGFSLIWVLSLSGLVLMFFDRRLSGKKHIILSLALFSFLSICPGYNFREHYFVLLLPAAALLAGIAIGYLGTALGKIKFFAVVLFAFAVLPGITVQRDYLFFKAPALLSRDVYGESPFPESIEIAKYISSHSADDETIAILGSEPQIYFYAKRRAASGYIYMYPLMEGHKYSLAMQQEMAREIEEANPRFLIFVNTPSSWLFGENYEKYIFGWFERFIRSRSYKPVGIVDISADKTAYRWGKEIAGYRTRSLSNVIIFERP